ncbi:ATP-dependent helicase HrpB [Aliidiomarina sp. Khilg15.8]
MTTTSLPVTPLLPELAARLPLEAVVLQAPPGAGKSTALPLYLLRHGDYRRIILVQPRRLAAVSIARYLAQQLGEAVGDQIGYQVRQERKSSSRTRLLVVTEGILTRLLQSDPALDGCDLVIFDEFHERNLHSDLGLALTLESRELRPQLQLLVMSATLPAATLADWLRAQGAECAVMQSEGRQYPVELSYQPPAREQPWLDKVIEVVKQVATKANGDLLVFLPGQAEIRRMQMALAAAPGMQVLPLHGGLTMSEQERVLAPLTSRDTKVVLATNIAETSLTLDGIEWVIDSGRERQAQFRPRYQVTQLITRRISRAAATQRAGRAGRTQAGFCVRVWSESEMQSLAEYRPADIEQQDLTELVLEVAVWGSQVADMAWFTPPNPGHADSARATLQLRGALDRSGKATPQGQQLSEYATDVAYAALLHQSQSESVARQIAAAWVVAMHEEREFGDWHEVTSALGAFQQAPKQFARTLRRFEHWCRRLQVAVDTAAVTVAEVYWALVHLYPERLAQRREQGGGYLLANGAGVVWPGHAQSQAAYLLVNQVSFSEQHSSGVIRQFLEIDENTLLQDFAPYLESHSVLAWRGADGGLEKQHQRRVGAIVLQQRPDSAAISAEERVQALIEYVRGRGLSCLQWDARSLQLQRRLVAWTVHRGVSTMRFDDDSLLASLETWAAPYWQSIRTRRELQAWTPFAALKAQLDYTQWQQVESALPDSWRAPSGRAHRIEYQADGTALVALKLQEVFGTPQTPMLNQGRLPLTFDLLSPAGRLLQRTQDLAAFWAGAYVEVRKEMRGRYPKHPWPDDPATATATHLTKRALKS